MPTPDKLAQAIMHEPRVQQAMQVLTAVCQLVGEYHTQAAAVDKETGKMQLFEIIVKPSKKTFDMSQAVEVKPEAQS